MTNLLLRTVSPDGISRNGFRWPLQVGATVVAPDWDPDPSIDCGFGLHGFLWGEGDGFLADWGPEAVWLVVEADHVVPSAGGGKHRFGSCVIRHVGDQQSATQYLLEHGGVGKAIIGATVSSGDYGTSTSGHGGTSTSGDDGTSTSGDDGTSISVNYGTSISGNYGTSTSGHGGTSTSGYGGTSTSGYGGTSTSGDGGTSTSGYGGTSISGDGGTSTSGHGGTSISGDGGTSTSGHGGTSISGDGGEVSAGVHGTICIWYHNCGRMRLATSYVGEGGIKAGTMYRCDGDGNFVEGLDHAIGSSICSTPF